MTSKTTKKQNTIETLLFFGALITPFFFVSDMCTFLQNQITFWYPQDVAQKMLSASFFRAYLILFAMLILILPSIAASILFEFLHEKQAEEEHKKLKESKKKTPSMQFVYKNSVSKE